MATKDLLLDCIEMIEKDGHQYVLGVIKKDLKDKSKQNIEIYCNIGQNPMSKLLEVLKEYQKNNKVKVNKEIIKDDKSKM